MSHRTRGMAISRREFLSRGGQALVLALLAGCTSAPRGTGTPTLTETGEDPLPIAPGTQSTAVQATPEVPTTHTPTREEPSLDVKIGQMLLVGFRGLTLTEDNPIVRDIRERHIGAVVLFDYDFPSNSPVRNIQSPEQVKALTAALQAKAQMPLIIAVDQEGGNVVRLKEQSGFPQTVSEQYLGTHDDLTLTRRNAETMARGMAAVGINLNLAPVVDLNTNPDNPIIGRLERSFSADPSIVIRHAIAEIEAHRQLGVLTTLKHFPGHGSSRGDSHQGLVDVSDTWSRVELEPYRNMIASGKCDAIMTAHIFNRNLDPKYPATLSASILTGILRNGLDYEGLIISDDMQMGAISFYYGLDAAVVLAIQAGVDILAFANNQLFRFDPNIAGQVISIIKQAVKDREIDEARIDESFQRIQRLKARLSLPGHA